jgi:hypothetical protein
MQKLRYLGEADQMVLSSEDMAKLGIEDHPGLWWTKSEPVLEIEEDEVAEAVLGAFRGRFKVDPTDEEIAAELVEKSRDDLVIEAEAMDIKITGKMTKEEIADAIVAKQAELDGVPSEGVPSANEGADAQPHA